MNIEPLKKIRDHLKFGATPLTLDRNHVIGFNMDAFRSEYVEEMPFKCDTIACIGGHVVAFEEPNFYLSAPGLGLEDRAYELILGKDYDTTSDEYHNLYSLFYPPSEVDYETITVKQSIKALENFINTGEAKWTEILYDN